MGKGGTQQAFEVIIVGAGPGGSSLATFLGRRGVSTLLVDRAHFPRDKVCGDGLTPKALYWLDVLGCVREVLQEANSFIDRGDIFINGSHVLTGKFPQSTPYPGFGILLERKRLDHLLVRNAVAHGATFRPGCKVKKLHWTPDAIWVEAEADGTTQFCRAKLVVGADGANSTVSRAIGNKVLDGATAVSLRGYYQGVPVNSSPVRLYFNERFFPGYGWVFVDQTGKANVGIGYLVDRNFPVKPKLSRIFEDFLATELKDELRQARPLGPARGAWNSFYRPRSMVAPRVMLIGDAANLADPINGGGIHVAMESAYAAADVALQALAADDFSPEFLQGYERLWQHWQDMDWRTGEMLLTLAKNPHLRDIYLWLIRTVARVCREDPGFQEFCGSIFSGVMPARKCLCPSTLLQVTPLDPRKWLTALLEAGGAPGGDMGLLTSGFAALRRTLEITAGIMGQPLANLNWGLEVLAKAMGLLGCYTNHQLEAAMEALPGFLTGRAAH